ncbi:MAG: rRNA maturation RNase YbeY [Candidatus Omnitrophica bacterium]|nr:rRNA maturation RNase YbeY [Candidatus Omnitrophota bacterium]MCF7892255.1 rRNA maturation RNase YbeY [Candidatus Omnitrophota bacterium]MCF7897511.1 rRNA maturation RNase YbeY [Candidatus Omnitrophota bacterium]MCF7909074.1 rRNA maturation RNase YbeY [Candidatus Omnitrophota bacterium]
MDILNQQRIKKIDIEKVRGYLKKIFFYLSIESKKASFVLSDNRFIVKLNKEYFSKDTPTDVISFNLADEIEPDYLGEVVVSVEEAVVVAEKLKIDWQVELLLYLIHGILHLIGFEDSAAAQRKKMEEKQREILLKFQKIKLS